MFKLVSLLTVLFFSFLPTSNAAIRAGRFFNRSILVIFENTNYADALRQPFFGQLALHGANFSNFMALTHPSQGNYIALTSGSQNGVVNDNPVDLNVFNIVDLMEAQGVTWKVYAEDYPGNCFVGKSSGLYARKHNPFISYVNIQRNPARCANIVNASQFDQDAAKGLLPNFVFYIPNLNNDGHDTGVAYADKWFGMKFAPYLNNAAFMQNTVLISTFDESGFSPKNQIYTSIVGPRVKVGNVADGLNIVSLLALFEDNWAMGNLGKQDVTAPRIPNIWQ